MAANKMKLNSSSGFGGRPRTPEVMESFSSMITSNVGLSEEYVGLSVVDVCFNRVPSMPLRHNLSPPSLGKFLHLIRLGHEKPNLRKTGAQPLLAR